jgi:IS605 OrfB family transposase
MLSNRKLSSSKYYKSIPCALSKSLIVKYQKNKKCKRVNNLVLPICGDKGKQVKIVENGLRIPCIFKKDVIKAVFPKEVIGFIRQIEFFKRDKVWYMSYCYNVAIDYKKKNKTFIGVDRNSKGNVATVKTPDNFYFFGPDCSGINANWTNRRRKLQKKGAKKALTKLKRKQARRTKDINHKVSRQIVNLAIKHHSSIVLEDLGKIAKKGKAKRYVNKSQWSFYQLETFIKYKAILHGIEVIKVNPAYTSQICPNCGSINKPRGKKYICHCGFVGHRDIVAATNIQNRGVQDLSGNKSGLIDDPQTEQHIVGVKSESSGAVR